VIERFLVDTLASIKNPAATASAAVALAAVSATVIAVGLIDFPKTSKIRS